MAKVSVLVDDFDHGSTADETIRYMVDGWVYEIDLTTDRAEKFRTLFGKYIAVSRTVDQVDDSAAGVDTTEAGTNEALSAEGTEGSSPGDRGSQGHVTAPAFSASSTRNAATARAKSATSRQKKTVAAKPPAVKRSTKAASGKIQSIPDGPVVMSPELNREIRDWARQKGIKVNSRGRIPGAIARQYLNRSDTGSRPVGSKTTTGKNRGGKTTTGRTKRSAAKTSTVTHLTSATPTSADAEPVAATA